MATAATNRAQVRYSTETTWGETPGGQPVTELRITSESLQHQKDTRVSRIVVSDRQRTDVLEVGQSATGAIDFELSYGDWEAFFESVLFDTISSATVSFASTVFGVSTITRSGAGDGYTVFLPDQWIKIDTGGGVNDNAVVKVVSATSTVLTFTGSTLIASTISANITGRRLRNGVTETSFYIETDFSDISAVKYFTGMEASQLSMNSAADEIVTGTFSMIGKAGAIASATVASAVVSAGANTPMTGTSNVLDLREGNAPLSTAVQSVGMTVQNNLRALRKIGSKPAFGIGTGGVDVTGTLNAYFEDVTLYQKFINHGESSLSFKFKDIGGNFIVVTIPSVYYTAGNPQITGQDADVFVPLEWTARKDPAHGYTVQLDFLPS